MQFSLTNIPKNNKYSILLPLFPQIIMSALQKNPNKFETKDKKNDIHHFLKHDFRESEMGCKPQNWNSYIPHYTPSRISVKIERLHKTNQKQPNFSFRNQRIRELTEKITKIQCYWRRKRRRTEVLDWWKKLAAIERRASP